MMSDDYGIDDVDDDWWWWWLIVNESNVYSNIKCINIKYIQCIIDIK